MPPFVPAPTNEGPMVVMTVRMSPKKRDAIRLLWRSNAGFNSVSHVIQTAVDEFLAKRS
jgi:Arc/MetJ-type ribon-helix-helix transcriptional regulator